MTMYSITEIAADIKKRYHGVIKLSQSSASVYIKIPHCGIVRISNHESVRPEKFNLCPQYIISEWVNGRYFTDNVADLITAIRQIRRHSNKELKVKF